jgi:hypothetical protein
MSAHGDSGDEEVMFKDQEVEEVSEASQAEIENLLNEVNGMSPETLNVYLEHILLCLLLFICFCENW